MTLLNKCLLTIFLLTLALGISSCGKKDDPSHSVSQSSALSASSEQTHYEVQCITQPPPPPDPSVYIDPNDPYPDTTPVPDKLPSVNVPLNVSSCAGLPNGIPLFGKDTMPGMVAVIDCKLGVVRFKTRDWQLDQTAQIGPDGSFDTRVMYVVRLARDAVGNTDCWARILGHVTGVASCPLAEDGKPLKPSQLAKARLKFHVEWLFDLTPPGAMQPPTPNVADSRNGKHCTVLPPNCSFSNDATMGCSG